MHTINAMEFTCDPTKNETNIRTRGLPLLAARTMFNSEMVVYEDTRQVYPERRFIGYATLAGRLMVVVFCLPSDERIHIISFRKAKYLSERQVPVSKRNLKIKASDPAPNIDWAVADSALLVDTPDDDSPELTVAQLRNLRPLLEVLPTLSTGKTRITIMLDDAVLQAYKARASGRGYQTLINETLRRALVADALKEALREVIREELHTA